MLFILGRELLMDVHDIAGDSRSGFKTLPMVLGEKRSSKIGLCIQLIGVFLMLPIIIYEPSLWKGILWSIMLLFMMAVWLYWWKVPNRQKLTIIRLMRIPLLFGLLILIV
jgi:4-hydroxybenzoate polyprenyltransferase